MPKSMTGFGSARRNTPFGALQIELQSVNNRFLDLQVRGLSDLREWEQTARQTIQKRINRGKVDMYLNWERAVEIRPRMIVNSDLLEDIFGQVNLLAAKMGVQASVLLQTLGQVSGLIESRTVDLDMDALTDELNLTLDEALDRIEESRVLEGKALVDDLMARGAILRENRQFIMDRKDDVVEKYRARLDELISRLRPEAQSLIDSNRLEGEVVLYADRCDVTEELTRLGAHLDNLDQILADEKDEPVGKNLEFLVQELLRETNTIGSKGRDTDVIQAVLRMKNEIEKIREQVMNLE